jgi:hypothetical protein
LGRSQRIFRERALPPFASFQVDEQQSHGKQSDHEENDATSMVKRPGKETGIDVNGESGESGDAQTVFYDCDGNHDENQEPTPPGRLQKQVAC